MFENYDFLGSYITCYLSFITDTVSFRFITPSTIYHENLHLLGRKEETKRKNKHLKNAIYIILVHRHKYYRIFFIIFSKK